MLTIVFYTTVILMCSISTLHCRAMWTMERNAILHLELISGENTESVFQQFWHIVIIDKLS